MPADVTTLIVTYLATLRANATVPPTLETTTLVAKDLPTVRTASTSLTDLATAYVRYLA